MIKVLVSARRKDPCKGLQVYRLQDLLVIIQSKFPVHAVSAVCCGKAQCDHIQKRQCNKDQREEIQRQDHPYGACSMLTHWFLLHRDLTVPAILLLIFLPDLPALHLWEENSSAPFLLH